MTLTNCYQIPIPTNHAEYLELRKNGVGASDVAAIAGLSRHDSAYDMFLAKTGMAQSEDNKYTRWGRMLEGFVTDLLKDSMGTGEVPDGILHNLNAICVHVGKDYHRATPDLLIVGKSGIIEPGNGDFIVVDLKTTTSMAMKYWEGNLPMEYFIQLQWQMHVTGAKRALCYVAVLDARESFPFFVERDEELIQKLIPQVDSFWDAVQRKDPSGLSMTVADWDKYQQVEPGTKKKATKAVLNAIAELREAQEQALELKDTEKKCKETIKKHMGEVEALVDKDDKIVATYKLVSAKPYSVPAKSYRKLVLVTPKKEKE